MIDDRDRQYSDSLYSARGSRVWLELVGSPHFEEGAAEGCGSSVGRQHEALLLHRASDQCELQQGAGQHKMPSAKIKKRYVWRNAELPLAVWCVSPHGNTVCQVTGFSHDLDKEEMENEPCSVLVSSIAAASSSQCDPSCASN